MAGERSNGDVPPLRPARSEFGIAPRGAASPQPLRPFRAGPSRAEPPAFSDEVETASEREDETSSTLMHELEPGMPWDVSESAPFNVNAVIEDEEQDTFPLDAFIIPEDTQSLPSGLAEADHEKRQRALDLADRLTALANRLREEGYSALARQTVHGDPVDSLIAGILAGYLAAHEE